MTVDDLARHGSVSPRTLNRHFRAAMGMPPGGWLQRERLRLAQRLLETTDDPIEHVSRRAGYDASVTMRAQFALRLHTSPRAYRRTFRASGGYDEARRRSRNAASRVSGNEIRKKTTATAP